MGIQYIPKAKNINIPASWIPFPLKGNGQIDAWLDTSLMEPFDNTRNVVWKILDNKYHVCLGGDTARINPDLVKNRKDSAGNSWIGVKMKNLRNPLDII